MVSEAESDRLVVVWRVTTRCNLSCGFCAFDRTLPGRRTEVDEVAARALTSWLAAERRRLGRPLHLSFLGGEPLLWRPLATVAAECSALGISLGVTTNGTTLSRTSTRELLLEHFEELTISIDGLGSAHDQVRGWPGGFAQLERAVRSLVQAKRAQGRGPLIRVNSVLMRENVAQLAELAFTLAGWGVEELTFNRLGERDRPEFFAQHCLGPSTLERLARRLPELRRALAERGLRLRGSDGYVERLLELERGTSKAGPTCDPGREFLFVDEHGRLAPCHFTLSEMGGPWPPNRNLAELSKRFLLRQSSASACQHCPSTQVAGKFGGPHGARSVRAEPTDATHRRDPA
ncbi:MAG: radical SAM protein [Myxococcales bacterium]